MALKGKKPEEVTPRLKAFFYGAAGVGKTLAAIQFPKPYIIDSEGATEKPQYVRAIEKAEGAVLRTGDFDELFAEVKELMRVQHEYKTLVIDSMTLFYSDLLEKAEHKVGTEFGRHYGEANKRMKHLLNLLFRIDMNVIITSHSKNEYSDGLKVVGQTFDCYKKLDYLFDLVFEIAQRGEKRVAIVRKSRFESFHNNDVFPFSYAELADRYGREVVERDSKVEELANEDDVARAVKLIGLLKIPETTVQKWLDKARSSSLDEMPKSAITKCIDHMQKQIGETQ